MTEAALRRFLLITGIIGAPLLFRPLDPIRSDRISFIGAGAFSTPRKPEWENFKWLHANESSGSFVPAAEVRRR